MNNMNLSHQPQSGSFSKRIALWVCMLAVTLFLVSMFTHCEANRYIKQPSIRDHDPSIPRSVVRFFQLPTGDATLIAAMDGHNVLIDTGTARSASILVRQLRSCHVQRLDTVILTVPSPEHVGGLDALETAFQIGQIIVSESTEQEFGLDRPKQFNHVTRKTVRAGDTMHIGKEISVHFFGPSLPLSNNRGDRSLVFRMRVEGITLLFTGDIGLEKETQYAKLPIQSKILQVPDHGRSDVVSEPFLHAVNPQVAIIGGGDGSRPQLPSEELMERMLETWIDVYPTTRLGTITVYCGPRSYKIVRP